LLNVSKRRPTPEMRMTGPTATWSTGINSWIGTFGINKQKLADSASTSMVQFLEETIVACS
jgi:hypothetical protein